MTWDPLRANRQDRELVMTRVLRGPRELVWRCFEDPDLLRQWWGPEDFTVTALTLDLRSGGHWHVTIRSPDGTEFATDFIIEEVSPPERLVYRNSPSLGPEWAGKPPGLYRATLTFEPAPGGETLLTLRFVFVSATDKNDAITRGFGRGTGQSLDKLERLLERPST